MYLTSGSGKGRANDEHYYNITWFFNLWSADHVKKIKSPNGEMLLKL